MIFRDYRDGDFQELSRLWEELDMGGIERGDNPEIVERTLKKGGRLIIMEDEVAGKIIGSSWMTYDGRRTYLHHFGITKEYQGKGLGKELAIQSLKYLKEIGAQVKLEVHKDNIIAKKLYEGYGFFAFTDYDIYMIRKVEEIGREEDKSGKLTDHREVSPDQR